MRKRLLALPERIATRLMGYWVRPDVLPEAPRSLLALDRPIVYVLEFGGLADRVALNLVCQRLGLPLPTTGLRSRGLQESSAVVVLRSHRGGIFRFSSTRVSARLKRIIDTELKAFKDERVITSGNQGSTIQVMPVSIYWGRSPDREASLLKQLFSENWKIGGRTSKFIKSLIHGRYTLVQFSEPLSLNPIVEEGLSAQISTKKVSRILRVHFRHRRIATLGPDLSHRRTLINRVLQNSAVQGEITMTSAGDFAAAQKLQAEASEYAYEIAADISYPAIRVMRKVLTRLWNRLYDGVKLDGIERLTSVVEGKELVYVPCHRSHIDYLLLSYSLYMEGMSLPHIAAGVNLNLPFIGKVLRRGGGFFLRRSFRDNRLYGLVFNAYLQEILQRGHALEYFIEGGRSRTGRLLNPKGGMLAMTVQGFLSNPNRPLIFVPVNFGYERLVEGGAFASELTGAKKQKETLGGLLRSLKLLRQEFGSVYVNIATPVEFTTWLDDIKPDWRNEAPVTNKPGESRPEWLKPIIRQLGDEIMVRINVATSVTPVSLLSLAMLTATHGRIAIGDLRRLLGLYQTLHEALPYSDEVVMTDHVPDRIIEHGINLKYIVRETYELGDIIRVAEKQTIPLSFFRNNVLHLFILPACVACCFFNRSRVAVSDIERLVTVSYPFIRTELFLRWPESELAEQIRATVNQLVSAGMLRWNDDSNKLHRPVSGSAETWLLLALGQSAMPSLQRYYLTVSVLSRFGSGSVDADTLGAACRQCAERLELVHGLQSPDFYDKELFTGFINAMCQSGQIEKDETGLLHFDDIFSGLEPDTRAILGEQVRHSILNITAKFFH